MLYNIPGRTGANLEPATIVRLVEAAPNIEAVKESSGQLGQITELIHLLPDNFQVFSGDDPIALPVICGRRCGPDLGSVQSRYPSEMSQHGPRWRWQQRLDFRLAQNINRKYFRLIQANFWETSPGPVKAVLAMMGRAAEQYRLPMTPVSTATRERLQKLADELGLLAHAPDEISHLRTD